MTLPDAEPVALLEAFLTVHAQGGAVPATLLARGEELHRRLAVDPPMHAAWGRFLVALGHLAAETCDDPGAASRYFLAAITGVDRHGDVEAAVTAGYDQGVLLERDGRLAHARAAYRLAASEGFRLRAIVGNTLRAALGLARLRFAEDDALDVEAAGQVKRAWLGWMWLRLREPEQLDRELASELGRTLAALLLPEDDPTELAARWRAWPPALLATDRGDWRDDDPRCLRELFGAAAEAADEHLRDEAEDPGAPYRMMRAAAERTAGSQ